ncbi:hypothetical protein KP509_07G052400 [Ceratopteris richardii]|uniref:Uncharacterized protein n=1 Tax=Ceratopteris richardii TaxID=49495 RepID=A0A8T2UL69_CERRI|nr:hypothetical protein KP509_07G052400 [Ceratopteris richardii]
MKVTPTSCRHAEVKSSFEGTDSYVLQKQIVDEHKQWCLRTPVKIKGIMSTSRRQKEHTIEAR